MSQLSFDGMLNDDEPETDEAPIVETGVSANTAMSIYSTSVEMEREDILIPRLRLAQGLTAEVQNGTAKPGMWVMTGAEAQQDLTVVPIMFTKRRELTDENFTILCRSNDAKVGEGDPGGVCSTCPMSQWREGGKNGKNRPPECTFIYSYVVFVAEHNAPAILEFKRTGIQQGKLLNTMSAQRGLGNFAVKLSSVSNQGAKGAYYTPAVQPVTVHPDILRTAREFLG